MKSKFRYFIILYLNGKKKKVLHKTINRSRIMDQWSVTDKAYKKDELGRNIPVSLEDPNFRIKEILPWWEEEKVFDFETKKHIRYHEMFDKILNIQEVCQVFTLNNKIFVQIENDVKVFGNKNLYDTDRLFELLKNQLHSKKKKNFLFIKDVTTYQRKQLYDFLMSKGFSRRELFRHYSY